MLERNICLFLKNTFKIILDTLYGKIWAFQRRHPLCIKKNSGLTDGDKSKLSDVFCMLHIPVNENFLT
jgi:hypothetical protein